MCFQTAYKLVLCLMRRLGQSSDKINAPVAGFLSACTLVLDTRSRRELITTLMMSRAIETSLYAAETDHVLPKSQYRNFVLWILANTFINTCVGIRRDILNKGILKFYTTWAAMKPNDKI